MLYALKKGDYFTVSLDKAIRHLKERRKPYRGAKAVDKTCRNHGSDDWATSDRLIQPQKELAKAADKLKEHKENTDG